MEWPGPPASRRRLTLVKPLALRMELGPKSRRQSLRGVSPGNSDQVSQSCFPQAGGSLSQTAEGSGVGSLQEAGLPSGQNGLIFTVQPQEEGRPASQAARCAAAPRLLPSVLSHRVLLKGERTPQGDNPGDESKGGRGGFGYQQSFGLQENSCWQV